MRKLPPLSALRVFEVAARTDSYVAAGRELGLTHGAVSRQIAALERWLGRRLFVRVGRRMTATQAARAFAVETGLAFDRIDRAAEACAGPAARRVLRVSAPTSFAMRWLIPRLDRFHALRPEVAVSVATVTTLHEELRGGFDVAIRRGVGAAGMQAGDRIWPDHRAVGFLAERDTLIASPALLRACRLDHPAQIAGHRLLSTETRPRDWTDWLAQAGLPHPAGPRQVFDHFFVTLQAVLDGLGLGIGPLPMLQGELQAGRLVAPFPSIGVTRPGTVALVPADADRTASLLAFLDWLVEEGARPASSIAAWPPSEPPRSG